MNWWELDTTAIRARRAEGYGGDTAAAHAAIDTLLAEIDRLNKRHAAIRNADPLPDPCCEAAHLWHQAAAGSMKTAAQMLEQAEAAEGENALLKADLAQVKKERGRMAARVLKLCDALTLIRDNTSGDRGSRSIANKALEDANSYPTPDAPAP